MNIWYVPSHVTIVSEIFAGCNFHKFRQEGWICENSFMKFNVGMYKMAAIYTFVVSGNVGIKGDCLLFIVLD